MAGLCMTPKGPARSVAAALGSLALWLALLAAQGLPAPAQDAPLIPERRLVLTRDSDFYGADIQSILDTTLEACEAACLADSRCQAFTFNSRSGACFPKTGVTRQVPYQGAWSGWVRGAAPAAAARAATRRGELAFLGDDDLARAHAQAATLANDHVTGDRAAEDLLAAAAAAAQAGNALGAARFQGRALNLTDAADQWLDYARLMALAAAARDAPDAAGLRARALDAAVNAYLRAEPPGLRASILAEMAAALEAAGRGRDMIPALRLAQSLAPRDDTAAALDDAIGKYGFRIDSHEVRSDSARPRICAVFTGELLRSGEDYSRFVALPGPGLSVEASGNRICVGGLVHGQRYALTFREGLPALSGEVMQKDVTVTAYVRDRSPAVRFPGRAYILPRAAGAGLPVETVNAATLDLALSRVSDRNLIRAIQNDYFARPLDYYEARYFNGEIAEEIWRGTAEVAMEVNRDITTRLPLESEAGPLAPGIYALSASVPGQDPYDRPAATQWFVVSDFGLTTLRGVDGLHVVARSLATAGPKPGAEVALVSRANRVLGRAVTDAAGYAHFPAALTGGGSGAEPALVTITEGPAEAPADFAFLPLTDPEFDLSDRGVAGRAPAPPIDLFLATDRGAYRAGETVHATALARDARGQALEGLPLTLRLVRPDGVEYARVLAGDGGAGGHVAALPVAAGAPRGAWRIEAFADPEAPPLAGQTILVEDFLPERIDFDLAIDAPVLSLAAPPGIAVEARYLFGAPGAGLSVEGDLRLAGAAALPDWPGYRFGRPGTAVAPWFEPLYGEPTDAAGRTRIAVVFPDLGPVGEPLSARMTVRLAEGSGRPVERAIERVVMPAAPVIGIRPHFEGGALAEGATAAFDLIALGPDARPAAAEVHWQVNRVETDYQWYGLQGQWSWEPITTREPVAEGRASLAASGPVAVSAPVAWGEYEIVVTATGGNPAATSMEFTAGWYAAADAAAAPDMLELALDRPAYRPGEVARLRLVPKAAGVALVSVLSNRLIAMQAVEVTEGENLVELPVTADWGTGAYVTASVLRPLAAGAGRSPARALGLAHAAVDPGERRLAAAFETPPAADPRGPLPVALKVEGIAPGETAWATIAAVDAGILNLTGFASPDPAGHYFGQRRLGIGIRDLYGRLIDGQSGAMGIVRSGGDAGAGSRLKAPPPTEELVAYFDGPVAIGPDGYARTEFALPSFNGTVRLMAVVWSRTGIGQAEAEVLVRDPVVVSATLPRFLAPGDESRLLLEIVHASGPAGRMGLDVTAAGGVSLGAAPSGLDLAENGKAVVEVPLTAGPGEATATVRVALTTPAGRQLVRTLTLPVAVNDPEIARQSRFTLAAGQSLVVGADAFAGLVPGTGRATLAIGPVARFDAPGLLAALDAYPYGCTEQLTSKAMPLLYFAEMASTLGLAGGAGVRERVDQSIREILVNQSANGAFGLWQADAGDLWLDAYASDFLSRARAAGHAVPDTAFRNAIDNLRNQVNYAPDFDADGGAYAYALMVLAREGAAAVGDLRYYADVKAAAFDTPIAAAQLGAALASYGDQTRADRMFARAAEQIAAATAAGPEPQIFRADYGTRLRDAAALLALAAEAGSAAVPSDRLGEAVAAGMAGRSLSTQEATWALLATEALIDRPGSAGFTIDGQPVEGPLVRLIGDEAAGAGVSIANGSGREATVTLTTFGVPTEPEPAGGKGYTITRSYYTPEGAPVDPAEVARGARLVAVIEVTPHAAGAARLIVDDPLPAGFEIDNPNLIRAGDLAALDWLAPVGDTRMTEFRQDRFLAAVDWQDAAPFRLAYVLRAVSPGRFHHPAASVEDMYRPDYRARSAAGTVVVTGG